MGDHPLTGRKRLPHRRAHELVAVEHGGFRLIVGTGRFPDRGLAEVFINTNKPNTAIDTLLQDAAIVLSFALQHGADAAAIRRALAPSGPLAAVLDAIEENRR
jgi:hypothetical protein